MNAAVEDFGGRRHGASWHRLLLVVFVAHGAALAQTVRAEDSVLQPLNTFTTAPTPRIERISRLTQTPFVQETSNAGARTMSPSQ